MNDVVDRADFDPRTIPLGGTTFIEASAGTGKTHALATVYLRLLIEQGLRPAEILVVTFTKAATAELRDRIRQRIRETLDDTPDDATAATLRRALRDFDEAAIFTIHGFCQRTLQENAFESGLGFAPELVEEPKRELRTLAHDLCGRLLAEEDEALAEWLVAGAGRKRWDFAPETLFRWMHELLGADEEMPVLPDAGAAASRAAADRGNASDPVRSGNDADAVAALVASADRAWLEFAASWPLRRNAVVEVLCDESTKINRGKYKPEAIRKKWVDLLDELACEVSDAGSAALRIGIVLPEIVGKYLTAEKIRANMNQKSGPPPNDVFFEVCSRLVAALAPIEASFDRRALALRRRFVDAVREEAKHRRDAQHVLFFDDLLTQLGEALRGEPGERLRSALRARYRFALIDEFQDTDVVQYEIFRAVWHAEAVARSGGGLILIGDAKQAIYAFRGADVQTYLAARRDARAVHTLGLNYRSDPPLIAAVNALFAATEDPFALEEIGFTPVAPAVDPDRPALVAPERFRAGLRVSLLTREAVARVGGEEGIAPGAAAEVEPDDESDDESESGSASGADSIPVRFARTRWMQAMARDVAELLESGATLGEGPIAPSHVAVLARTRRELDAARRALEALGIACVSRGEGNVFESTEAWELASVLAAWLHPGDPGRLRAALSTGAHGLDAGALALLGDDSSELAVWAERFADYGRIWSAHGFARAFETWRSREHVSETLLALQDGDRRLTNWLHLAELLARVANERRSSRSGLAAWLDRAIADEAVRIELGREASLLRLERDDEAVQLVTLHASKGLQYEFVYLPALWNAFAWKGEAGEPKSDPPGRPPVRFHDAASGRRTLDLGLLLEDDYVRHRQLAQAEAAAEHLRLVYVGLTRARRQCIVYWGSVGKAYGRSPLARLLLGAHPDAAGLARAEFANWARGLDDAAWRAAWQAIADAAPAGAIRVEESLLAPRPRWQPRGAAAPEDRFAPEVEAARPLVLRPLATTSFSGLVRGAPRTGAGLAGPLATGRDLDAEVDVGPTSEDGLAEVVPDLEADMHAFPRGADAGTLLHEVLERADLRACDPAAIHALALEWVGRGPQGLEIARPSGQVVAQVEHVVRSVARTPLRTHPTPLRLGDLPRDQILSELEFTLAAPGDGHGHGLSPETLADILAEAPAGSPLGRYAERAASLSWSTLNGFLRGFIDAVFCDGERYFVVDYKSNHLGTRQRDYLPDGLLRPMLEHDYVLQYLLYTIAVDRHLALRIVDYDYDRHFGGVYYLFLRGLAERHVAGCGIFFDRPEAEVVRRVSALLGGMAGGTR